jgi:hypothetical protein
MLPPLLPGQPFGQAVADIFQEVDEEVRRENMQRLWKRYGRYATAVIAVVLLGVFGVIGWQKYSEHRESQRSQAFADAIALMGDPDPAKAKAAFQELAQGGDGIAVMARFREAAQQVEAKDEAGAVATYDAIAADGSVAQPFRDAANLVAAMHLVDSAELAEIKRRLDPLTAPASPWRYSAQELIGLSAQRAGDFAQARTIFTLLADDLSTPSALRGRAAEMLAALKDK